MIIYIKYHNTKANIPSYKNYTISNGRAICLNRLQIHNIISNHDMHVKHNSRSI